MACIVSKGGNTLGSRFFLSGIRSLPRAGCGSLGR